MLCSTRIAHAVVSGYKGVFHSTVWSPKKSFVRLKIRLSCIHELESAVWFVLLIKWRLHIGDAEQPSFTCYQRLLHR